MMRLVKPRASGSSGSGAYRRSKGEVKPTYVSLVEKALIAADDFMSMEMLQGITKANLNQVSASLSHLKKRHAADSVVGGNDKLWWFATPETDTRVKKVEERVPEEKGNRSRKGRIVTKTAK